MPTILHAAWIVANAPDESGRLFLWGEESGGMDPGVQDVVPHGRDNLAVRNASLRAHLVSPAILRHRLKALLADRMPGVLSLQRLTIHLPASPSVAGLAPVWQEQRISGVVLPASSALRLLRLLQAHILDRTGGAPDTANSALVSDFVRHFILGTDMRYWCIAAQYAQSLTRAGCVIPALYSWQGQLQVRWETWNGWSNFAINLDELAALMPGVCLAYGPNQQRALAATDLLQDFLNAVVHAGMIDAVILLQNDAAHAHAARQNGAMGQVDTTILWYRLLLGEAVPEGTIGPTRSQFMHQWQQWLSQAFDLSQGHVQIALALREPLQPEREEDDTPWCLEFGIRFLEQSDRTLKAEELWDALMQESTWQERWQGSHPGARLLAGLRMASHLCSPIARVLNKPNPVAVGLSYSEAYQFLTRDSQVLEQAGFHVSLPDWWSESPDRGLQLKMSVRDVRQPARHNELPADVHGQNFDLDWSMVLQDHELSPQELGRIAATDCPLIFMNDQWLRMNEDQIRAARQILAYRTQPQKISLIQALNLLQEQEVPTGQTQLLSRFAESTADPTATMPVRQVSLQGRIRDVWHRLQETTRDVQRAEPGGFVGQLRPYQKRGLAWLWYLHEIGLGACLADDMGLGKTVQTIALFMEQERKRPPQARWSRLLVCPASVMRNWQRELVRFAPSLHAYIHHGSHRLQGEELEKRLAHTDVVITSFGTARVDQDLLRQIPWHSLVVDEAQNIKNPGAKQSQAIRSFPGQHRLALTGTPLENSLIELWSILDFLNTDYLGSRAAFQRRFIRPIEGESSRDRLQRLKQLVQPFVLRRLKSDPEVIRDLPAKQEINVFCDLTPEQTHLYALAVEQALPNLQGLEGIRRRGSILALITQLRKIVNHPAMLEEDFQDLEGRSGKLDRFMEMLSEARENHNKALVFTTFVQMGKILQQLIQRTWQCEPDFLHGGVSMQTRQQMVDRFQEGGQDRPILILSVRTGGVGLNLTAANQVYHYDRWWNPAVENQATDRVHRIGQTRRVQVFKYIMSGTVEEHVDNLIRTKSTLAQDVLGSGEEWLTRLTNEQLQELLTLRLSQPLDGNSLAIQSEGP